MQNYDLFTGCFPFTIFARQIQSDVSSIPSISISDYTYQLPDEKIAVYPLSERDQSKLLVWNDGRISETLFSSLPEIVPSGSLLVFNNTKVIHARLYFRRDTGARIEIFCLEPVKPSDYQLSFQQQESVEWKCLVGNAKKWKQGLLSMELIVNGETVILQAEKAGHSGNAFTVRFSWDRKMSFAEIIECAGQVPIPPYLNRPAEASDHIRYQTLYAKHNGSVAAPTAGLHFTGEVLRKLRYKQVETAEITLHVGAGTFQPVKSDTISGHDMHTETVIVTHTFLQKLVSHQNSVIAVGTTSVRSLESLYWLGIKINGLTADEPLHTGQWDPYLSASAASAAEALRNIMQWMEKYKLQSLSFTTSIIIVPGYAFRIIQGMVTNFHQPQSTLLLLVGAFLGSAWKDVYEYALNNGFRFLSYGDSNIYLKEKQSVHPD